MHSDVTELRRLRAQPRGDLLFFTSLSSWNFWPATCFFTCKDKGKFEYARHYSFATFIAVVSRPLLPILYLQFLDNLRKRRDNYLRITEKYFYIVVNYYCDKWVPVTTSRCLLKLRMEERPAIWRVAANILSKQSRRVENGWCTSWGGREANNSSP